MGYECNCYEGFEGDGFVCYEDQCKTGTHNCDPAVGICNSTEGNYACSCPEYFSRDGYSYTSLLTLPDGKNLHFLLLIFYNH